MSTSSTSSGNNKWLLYLILGAAGLWVLWQILKLVYYALSYVSINSFLTLDLSVYGQLSAAHWPGYVLLGLIIGATGGALAAQRRYGLDKHIRTGGWASGLLAFGVLYTGIVTAPAAEPLPMVVDSAQETVDTTTANTGASSETVAVAPIATSEEDVVTEVEPAEEATPKQIEPAATPAESVREIDHEQQPTASVVKEAETEASALALPSGHQQHAGHVGNLATTYIIDWQSNGELSGSYYYDRKPDMLYRLTGSCNPNGELHLLEFTRGRQTARCVLQLTGGTFTGTMFNTDGRQFPMSLSTENVD